MTNLFEPRPPGDEETPDPRVAQLSEIIEQALHVGVNEQEIAMALPRRVRFALLREYRGRMFAAPSGIGNELSEWQPNVERVLRIALSHALATAHFADVTFESIGDEDSGVFHIALGYHWGVLRGMVMNELLPRHSVLWLRALAGARPDIEVIIVDALKRGEDALNQPTVRRYWAARPDDDTKTTTELIEELKRVVAQGRKQLGGPPR